MTQKEAVVRQTIYTDSNDFDVKMKELGEYPYGPRARGVKRPDGSMEVFIDESYYRGGGIRRDQLEAIATHEKVELSTGHSDGELQATIAEYQHILAREGPDGLKGYHTRLNNLIGAPNQSIRNKALKVLLEK